MKNVKNKQGITLTSLIVYLLLFTMFTITTLMVTSNLNKNIFSARADVENSKNLNLITTYFVESSKNSENVENINNKLVFSNNDEYEFNADKKEVYLNNRKIIKNVYKFIPTVNDNVVYINVTFEKYGKILNKELKFSLRGEAI